MHTQTHADINPHNALTYISEWPGVASTECELSISSVHVPHPHLIVTPDGERQDRHLYIITFYTQNRDEARQV